jgi:hypothetical protein
MKKPNNYDILCTDYIEGLIGEDFKWGEITCFAIALKATDHIYNSDLFGKFKEAFGDDLYNEEDSLSHCKNSEGLSFLRDVGFKEVSKMHSGDILYCVKDGWECIHTYVGGNFVSAEIEGKVALIPAKTLYRHLKLNSTEYLLLSCHQ